MHSMTQQPVSTTAVELLLYSHNDAMPTCYVGKPSSKCYHVSSVLSNISVRAKSVLQWRACNLMQMNIGKLEHSGDLCMLADGEQIAVDMLNGLSSVPENRRQEVQQQLAQLKSLAEAALR